MLQILTIAWALVAFIQSSESAPYIIALGKKTAVPELGEAAEVAAAASAVKQRASTLGIGAYHIKLSLGTPPQTFNGIFDTGSSVIHMPCKGHKQRDFKGPYARTASSTKQRCKDQGCHEICGDDFPSKKCSGFACSATKCQCDKGSSCTYETSYADGSYAKGPVYRDSVTFPGSNMPATQLAWGCASKFSAKMFLEDAPLFVGMAWQKGSLYSQLHEAGRIDDVFGFCLGDGQDDQEMVTDSSPGLLVLGSANVTSGLKAVYKTQLITPSEWPGKRPYPPGLWVEVAGMEIGEGGGNIMAKAGTQRTKLLLDTGSSAFMLGGELYKQYRKALIKGVQRGGAESVEEDIWSGVLLVYFKSSTTAAELDRSMPTLYFTFGPEGQRVRVPVPPSVYLRPLQLDLKLYFVAFTDSDINIMGNAFLVNMWIQAKQSTKALTIGLVDNCDSIRFEEAPFSRRAMLSLDKAGQLA